LFVLFAYVLVSQTTTKPKKRKKGGKVYLAWLVITNCNSAMVQEAMAIRVMMSLHIVKDVVDEMKLSIHPSRHPSHHPSMDGII
jgi:negative regulator of replication initiation